MKAVSGRDPARHGDASQLTAVLEMATAQLVELPLHAGKVRDVHRSWVLHVGDQDVRAACAACARGDQPYGEVPVREVLELLVEAELAREAGADDQVRRASGDRIVVEHLRRELAQGRRRVDLERAQRLVDEHGRGVGPVRGLGGLELERELLGGRQVAVVKEVHPLALGGGERRIPRRGGPATVRERHHDDIVLHQEAGPVELRSLDSVDGHDDLHGDTRLPPGRPHGLLQHRPAAQRRDDHAERRALSGTFLAGHGSPS